MKHLLFIAVLLISISSRAATDSTITPKSGVAWFTPTSDTTADSFRLSGFIEIDNYYILDAGTANLLTITMEEGDLATYTVVRYNLYDYSGRKLFTNRYRIYGSCYGYLMSQGIAYAFWKICNEKGFTPKL